MYTQGECAKRPTSISAVDNALVQANCKEKCTTYAYGSTHTSCSAVPVLVSNSPSKTKQYLYTALYEKVSRCNNNSVIISSGIREVGTCLGDPQLGGYFHISINSSSVNMFSCTGKDINSNCFDCTQIRTILLDSCIDEGAFYSQATIIDPPCASITFENSPKVLAPLPLVEVDFVINKCTPEQQNFPLQGFSVCDMAVLENNEVQEEGKYAVLRQIYGYRIYTLLLLDASNSILSSPQAKASLIEGAKKFVTVTSSLNHFISAYYFDGQEDIAQLIPFSSNSTSFAQQLGNINLQYRDPATNLFGAVLAALQALSQELGSANLPYKQGNVVILSDGRDSQSYGTKYTLSMVKSAVTSSNINVFSMQVGFGNGTFNMQQIQKNGFVYTADVSELEQSFEKVSEALLASIVKRYTIRFCSVKRVGSTQISIHVGRNSRSLNINLGTTPLSFRNCFDNIYPPNFVVNNATCSADYKSACSQTNIWHFLVIWILIVYTF